MTNKKAETPVLEQRHDGEWHAPKRRGYLMGCCDCGLVHRVNFKIHKSTIGNQIVMQAFRSEEATQLNRKTMSEGVSGVASDRSHELAKRLMASGFNPNVWAILISNEYEKGK